MAIQKLNQGAPTSASQVPFFDTTNGQDRRASMTEVAALVAAQMQAVGYTLVIATVGIPSDGIGIDGQLAVDGGAGVIYLKSGGVWALYGGGGGATVPGAPTIGAATAGDGTVSVAFTAPSGDGGSAITGYQVLLSNGNTATGPASPISVTTPNGVAVTATVRAQNAIGYGAYSAASNSVTPSATITAPGAPTGATATAGDAEAEVAFTAPASDGGAAITGYRVTSSTGETATGASSPITVPGLDNGVAVTFTVAAQNSAGYGPESSPSNSVTPSAAVTDYGTTDTLRITASSRVRLGAGRIVSLQNDGANSVDVTLYDDHTATGRVVYTGTIAVGATTVLNERVVLGAYLALVGTSPAVIVTSDEG